MAPMQPVHALNNSILRAIVADNDCVKKAA